MLFSLNMIFWDTGDPIRLENTKFCWNRAKHITEYFTNLGVESKAFLFDFSTNKVIDDAIHIPVNDPYYQRSRKINLALNYEHNNSEIFGLIDSDCYFHKSYYEELKEDIIFSQKNNSFFTYQLIDIPLEKRYEFIDFENNSEKFDNVEENLLTNNFTYRHSAGYGTMGGFFICGTQKLKEVGGFNEKFLTWGAEDDEATSRLRQLQGWMTKVNKGPIHLGHNKDVNNSNYFIPVYSDKYYEVNKINYGPRFSSKQ